ncbi:MAG: carbohydrate ABC transporter permease [Planctomycetota bacterium]|jgi:multiple sugar transport system permease protein
MPIIPRVGRKSLRMRSLVIFVYAFLIIGSITTVYPFALMFATSFTSHTDFEEYRLIPSYWHDFPSLMVKYLDDKNKRELFDMFKLRYHLEEPFEGIISGQTVSRKYGRFVEMKGVLEDYDLESPQFKARVGDWLEFIDQLPLEYKDTFFYMYIIPAGLTQAGFQDFLKARYPTIEELRAAIPEDPDFYVVVFPPFEAIERHAWYPPKDAKNELWLEFKEQLPVYHINVMTVLPIYQEALLDKYDDVAALNDAWGASYKWFWQVPFPDKRPPADPGADWDEFAAVEDPVPRFGHLDVEICEDAWTDFLRGKYETIERYNEAAGTTFGEFGEVPLAAWPDDTERQDDWREFYETAAPPEGLLIEPEAHELYARFAQEKYGDIESYNATFARRYRSFDEVPCPNRRPSGTPGDDWEEFVRKKIPMRYVRLDLDLARPAYITYITETFETVTRYKLASGYDVASLAEATLDEYMPEQALAQATWQDFYEDACPIDAIVMDTADVHYERFLADKYSDAAAMNAAYGGDFASFAEVEPPWRETDYWDLTTRKGETIKHFLTRNYRYVLKRVFLQGRPLLNTFILVTLTVFAQVTVNPLAAYALSRYKLTYTAKVLIFLLATMAFPAQVTMIPNFLMIKRLGLMNTFGALVLPGLANGYYVFLLKGFFDSLPQELYEAGSIDGASEFKMFYMITLPLSLPVLSVIALYAFGMSYGSFLWALTTCQDKKMWTLMVFLQQFQIDTVSVPYVMMAALILAAIPTMVVFLSAQKVLMRGIVVPTMK